MKKIYVIFILSYTLGSIPFGLIITTIIKGINLKETGSKSIGATNVARTTGSKKLVALTLFLDSFKGFISVYIAQIFFCDWNLCVYISAILVVLGHIFPIWLKFNGGKGIATTLGILVALNVYVALIFTFIWLGVFFIFRYSSCASLVAISIAIAISPFFQKNLFFTLLSVAILVFFKHRKNITNLLHGKEYKFHKKS
ncbi:MAG: glycerol-3-phosphate 1-O-acyltransferase PlsY [Wolbachia endosymbiont of Meromenopon meropis]|nr:glycerol-3-phosphate 1-O-acyltransferase PlsY [Wolbachia endosymbiont of Meromenopon meropis]